MRLSNLADYAVVLLSAAARAGDGRLNASLLADETGVPLPTAQKLVGRLSAAGLLLSSRGAGGGIRLARAPAAISLADIVEAVEGPIALTACVEHGRHDCGIDHHCQVKPHWGAVNAALRNALAGVSLASLASPLPRAGGAGGGLDLGARDMPTPNSSRKREGSRLRTPSLEREGL